MSIKHEVSVFVRQEDREEKEREDGFVQEKLFTPKHVTDFATAHNNRLLYGA